MTPSEYRTCLSVLGLTHQSAGEALGCSWRQSYRWAKGDTPVPYCVELVLLSCIARNIFPEQMAAEAASAKRSIKQASAA